MGDFYSVDYPYICARIRTICVQLITKLFDEQ